MTHIRDIFDSVSISVIQFLESHKGVTNVQFFEIGGCSQKDIDEWERNNKPFILPQDLKNFLKISDGLLLRWNIKLNNEAIPLGNMHINSLETIKKIKTTDQLLPPKPFSKNIDIIKDYTAFSIDSAPDGNVCFVYKNHENENPEVWFQDYSCQWHYISEGFTEYYRLMIVHLGLPHWQYAFTSIGLDPITRVWFQFLSPERLAIDLKYHKKLLKWIEKQEQTNKKDVLKTKQDIKKSDENESEELSTDEEETDDSDQDENWIYRPQKINMKKINQILQRHQVAGGSLGNQMGSARDPNKKSKRTNSTSSLTTTGGTKKVRSSSKIKPPNSTTSTTTSTTS